MKRLTLIGILIALASWTNPANAQSDTLWYWQEGGLFGRTDRIRAIIELDDGSIISTGDINADISSAQGDGFLMKHSINGVPLWQKVYTKPGHQTMSDVAATSDGGFILVGQDSDHNQDGWVIRADSNGDTLWTRHFHFGGMQAINKVIETQHADGFLLGGTSGMTSDNPTMWAIRIDEDGEEIWSSTYGSGEIDSWCNGLGEVDDGNFILAGAAADAGDTNGRLYLVKIDAVGDTIWTHQYPDASLASTWTESFQINDNGDFIIGMSYVPSLLLPRTGMRLVKTDSEGEMLFDKRFFRNIFDNYCRQAFETEDGGYLAVGHTVNPSSNELLRDGLYIRTDSSGDSVGVRVFGGLASEEIALAALQAQDGHVVIGGHRKLGFAGQTDFFLMKLRNPAIPQVSTSLDSINFGVMDVPGSMFEEALSITNEGSSPVTIESMSVEAPFSAEFLLPATLQPNGSLFGAVRFQPEASGQFSDTLLFTFGESSLPVYLKGEALFTSVSDEDSQLPTAWDLGKPYPNPFNSSTIIPITMPGTGQATLSIFDINGRLADRIQLTGHRGTVYHNWQPGSLAAGVYFVRLEAGSRAITTRKLLFLK